MELSQLLSERKSKQSGVGYCRQGSWSGVRSVAVWEGVRLLPGGGEDWNVEEPIAFGEGVRLE